MLCRLSQLVFGINVVNCAMASPHIPRWTDGRVLNASYLQPYFTQPRDYINTYTDYSLESLTLAVNHTDGQFLDGTPDPVGYQFFWQSQNGWTGIAQWDQQQNKRTYFMDVLSAQNALARYPGDGYQQYGVPLVNTYNDDAAWAAMSNLQAYETYGNRIFLERAVGVWEVSDRALQLRRSLIASASSSLLMDTSIKMSWIPDISRAQNTPIILWSRHVTARACSVVFVSGCGLPNHEIY